MTQHDTAMDALDALDTRTMPGSWALVPPSQCGCTGAVPAHTQQGLWRAIKRQQRAQQHTPGTVPDSFDKQLTWA